MGYLLVNIYTIPLFHRTVTSAADNKFVLLYIAVYIHVYHVSKFIAFHMKTYVSNPFTA